MKTYRPVLQLIFMVVMAANEPLRERGLPGNDLLLSVRIIVRDEIGKLLNGCDVMCPIE